MATLNQWCAYTHTPTITISMTNKQIKWRTMKWFKTLHNVSHVYRSLLHDGCQASHAGHQVHTTHTTMDKYSMPSQLVHCTALTKSEYRNSFRSQFPAYWAINSSRLAQLATLNNYQHIIDLFQPATPIKPHTHTHTHTHKQEQTATYNKQQLHSMIGVALDTENMPFPVSTNRK